MDVHIGGYQRIFGRQSVTRPRRLELTANALKMIAILAMTVDHLAWMLLPLESVSGEIAHTFGRLTAPIMCYLAAEGVHYTRDPRRYLLRLFLFAALSHVPYVLFFDTEWYYTSILWGMAWGVFALWLCEDPAVPLWLKLGMILFACFMAVNADWNYIAVLWIVLLGLSRGDFLLQTAVLLGVGALYVLPDIITQGGQYAYRFGVVFTLPLLARYNGKRGRKSALTKWAFYWYYPLHLLLLAVVQTLFF